MHRSTDTAMMPLGNPGAAIARLGVEPARPGPARLLDLAAPAVGETVVDLGCRALADSLVAMRRVGAAGKVRGIVETRADHEHATALRDRWVFADLAYFQAPLSAVPMADGVADVVLVDGALEQAAEPLRILEEARRLLAPEGRLALGVGSAEADRLGALLQVMGLETRAMRNLGAGRTALLATRA